MTTNEQVAEYEISNDNARLDLDVIHDFLTQSYWSPGIPRATVDRSIQNSLCFGVYHGAALVGFARVVTDKSTFALLADLFILTTHRGKGLSKWLMRRICAHPELQGLRRFMLLTSDAHGLYSQFGFTELANASRVMEIVRPDLYRSPS
jgi:N-acetylglutamate synthase-like GNAT family acetyltransferase